MGEADQGAAAELLQLTSTNSPYGALAGFTIDKKIGKGQFSVVYRARATHDDRIVALKKVQIFEMMDSKARLDCMKEIQLLQVCPKYINERLILHLISAIKPSKCDQISRLLH